MSAELTHRELCRHGARWLLHGRGLHAAAWEVACGGGFADAVGVSTPDPAAEVTLRARDYTLISQVREAKMERRRSRAKAAPAAPLFVDLLREAEVKPHHLRAIERHTLSPVVAVVEAKTSRGDLLADLREAKLRRYEPASSECWLLAPLLALTSSRMVVPRLDVEHLTRAGADALCASLAEDGLPPTWGVLVYRPEHHRDPVSIVRPATSRPIESWEVVGWTARIAASYAHRALSTRGPMAEEIPT